MFLVHVKFERREVRAHECISEVNAVLGEGLVVNKKTEEF